VDQHRRHGGGAVCVWVGEDGRGGRVEGKGECVAVCEGRAADGCGGWGGGWGGGGVGAGYQSWGMSSRVSFSSQ